MIRLPVLVHKDEGSCYGVTIPDLPGCFTAGDTLAEALSNVREAAALYLEGADEIPSLADAWNRLGEPDRDEGFWMLVDIDEPHLDPAEEPDRSPLRRLSRRLDELAAGKGLSREELLARACLAYLKNTERA